MCTQCMMGAMSAGAAATGARVWLVSRAGARVTRWGTRALIAGGLVAGALIGPV